MEEYMNLSKAVPMNVSRGLVFAGLFIIFFFCLPAHAIFFFCLPAYARYSGGTGDPNDPYRIATAEDLNDIGNHEEDWDKHFILINDVNLAQYTGTQFKIIGRWISWNNLSNKPFTGIFDGNDHKVWNFTWASDTRSFIGLFGYVGENAQIKNLGLENVDVNATNGDCVGGLSSTIGSSTIVSNCYVTGRVSGHWDVGGLVGYNYGTINNCHSTGNVAGEQWVGGLVGENAEHGAITNSHSTGSVTGRYGVGGLVGYNYFGTITNCCSTGSVFGSNCFVSGLVGLNYGTIINCYSISSVTGSAYVGGLVGKNGGTITNCYSRGTVGGYDLIGGLVGNNSNGKITNCYSTGKVSGSGYHVSGLVGRNYKGTVKASFWNVQTSAQPTSASGIPKTTAEMKTKNTFTDAGWDFVNVWHICEATNYPRLRWQILAGDFLCPYGVDFTDFAVLASAWQSKPTSTNWKPACDISQPKDNFIDELDLIIFCENWLEATTGPP